MSTAGTLIDKDTDILSRGEIRVIGVSLTLQQQVQNVSCAVN